MIYRYFKNLVTSYQKCITVVRNVLGRRTDLKKHHHSGDSHLTLDQPYQPTTCSAAHACSSASQPGVQRRYVGLLYAFGPASMTS